MGFVGLWGRGIMTVYVRSSPAVPPLPVFPSVFHIDYCIISYHINNKQRELGSPHSCIGSCNS
jgi:hypothetical protein